MGSERKEERKNRRRFAWAVRPTFKLRKTHSTRKLKRFSAARHFVDEVIRDEQMETCHGGVRLSVVNINPGNFRTPVDRFYTTKQNKDNNSGIFKLPCLPQQKVAAAAYRAKLLLLYLAGSAGGMRPLLFWSTLCGVSSNNGRCCWVPPTLFFYLFIYFFFHIRPIL